MNFRSVISIAGGLFFLFLLTLALAGDEKYLGNHNTNTYSGFLDSAQGRLEESVPYHALDQIKSKSLKWNVAPTLKNLLEATDEVTATAAKYNVVSDVTIETLPVDGAKIKYQTVGERNRGRTAKTAKELTTCLETMPIGTYHIWSERKGERTSNSDEIYNILKRKEKVQICEEDDGN